MRAVAVTEPMPEQPARFVLTRGAFHDPIRLPDEVSQLLEFVLQLRDQHAKRTRESGRGIFEDSRQRGCEVPPAPPESDATLEQQTPDLVDHRRTPDDPPLPYPVQRLHVELVVCLDRNEAHGRSTDCFGNRLGIDEVALVRLHVRLHVLGRDDPHLVPLFPERALPMK